MRRLLYVAILLAGCETPPQAKKAEVKSDALDYSAFAKLTAEPIRVPMQRFEMCRPPIPFPGEERGPHNVPAIVLFANESASAHLKGNAKPPLPVGSIIVKEKWWDEKEAKPNAYAAMIKREPGYDAEHGDWEYLFVSAADPDKPQRGKLETCIRCHSIAADRDYVYGTYLKK